eukprot:CAMPEP_0185725948 /NCGR_PEP_ID=MMETSP1171-20130828/2070_1 /TAXON_ID=374046 /ORGANISM="Helicotheca tamensis, Strain CCMP826" /LENGTH=370 /DNA_ID=CAMNT_0028394201 /DNA_START=96 /DNA_END=1208 /DNA_ORIENTATION=-
MERDLEVRQSEKRPASGGVIKHCHVGNEPKTRLHTTHDCSHANQQLKRLVSSSAMSFSNQDGNKPWSSAFPCKSFADKCNANTASSDLRAVMPAAFVTQEQLKNHLSKNQQSLHQQQSQLSSTMPFRSTDAFKIAMARNNSNFPGHSSSPAAGTPAPPASKKTPSYNTAFRAMVEADEEITSLLNMLRTTGEDGRSVGPKPVNGSNSVSSSSSASSDLILKPKRESKCLPLDKNTKIEQRKDVTTENVIDTPAINKIPSCVESSQKPAKSILLSSIYSNSDISNITMSSDICDSNTGSRKRRRIDALSLTRRKRSSGSSVHFKIPPTAAVHVVDRVNSGWYTKEDRKRMEREANSPTLLPPTLSSSHRQR